MNIFIKNISVEVLDTSIHEFPNFQIQNYVVYWECENPITGDTLQGSIKTKQIENPYLVYEEIKAFIQEVVK